MEGDQHFEHGTDTKRNQELCAHLREDYLRTLAAMANHPVTVKMHENIEISAVYKGYHPDGKKILFSDVHIPMGGMLKSAILRTPDIISLTFPEKS